ncbi:hypothetical protein HK100_001039 [Physocladia obscura]|uniref:Pre-mRNA-splicing factor SYF2 n=1 Tax=Physocladia obscura TaxID=109957 RepID=A0AAD5SXD4_9FUNG|nr:hypothetical protein HK100_001039 [Physocladia obscura]
MDRTQKLASLKKQREEAVKANRKDVHREHVRIKYRQTQADETRAAKTRRTAEILALRVEAEEKGEDYERQRALGYSAEAVERYEEKEEEKRRRAEGAVFADFAQAAANKYTKLTDALAREHNNTTTANNNKPYADAALVAHVASAIASSSSSTSLNSSIDPNAAAYAALANVPSKLAVSKLVKDLEKQAEARKTFSKRRAHDPDADVTYINERNMRFNKKIARAYDKHTAEIKQAFERGTAL